MSIGAIGSSMPELAYSNTEFMNRINQGEDFSSHMISSKDEDSNGSLNISETGMPEDLFSKIDTDSDGEISREELLADIENNGNNMLKQLAEGPAAMRAFELQGTNAGEASSMGPAGAPPPPPPPSEGVSEDSEDSVYEALLKLLSDDDEDSTSSILELLSSDSEDDDSLSSGSILELIQSISNAG